jgi:hypothetical protein
MTSLDCHLMFVEVSFEIEEIFTRLYLLRPRVESLAAGSYWRRMWGAGGVVCSFIGTG